MYWILSIHHNFCTHHFTLDVHAPSASIIGSSMTGSKGFPLRELPVSWLRQAADTVLDRLPAHRRNLFEDEYRKLCKDGTGCGNLLGDVVGRHWSLWPQEPPATPEPRVPTPLSPVITDRRTSPLKQLHTVTVESAPLQPLPSPGMMPDCLWFYFVVTVSWILKWCWNIKVIWFEHLGQVLMFWIIFERIEISRGSAVGRRHCNVFLLFPFPSLSL